MIFSLKYILSFSLILFSFINIFSQSHKFRVYDIEQGMPEPFIYDIIQDDNGYLWVATGSGLAKFDGHNFEIFNDQNAFSSGFVNVCFIDSQKKLWLGLKNGDIYFYSDYKFIKMPVDKSITSIINDIKEDSKGNIWFVSQNNGLIKISKNKDAEIFAISDKLCYSMFPLDDGKLMLGTNEGIYIYDPAKRNYEDIDENPYTLIQTIAKDHHNNYWFGTEDAGILYGEYSKGKIHLEKFSVASGLENYKIQKIYFDHLENIWIATFGAGLVYARKTDNSYESVSNYNTGNGLKSNMIKCVYQDRESNIWIGMYGEGLSTLSDDFFTFFRSKEPGMTNNISAFYSDENNIWLGAENYLIEININDFGNWVYKKITDEDVITSLYLDVEEKLWIGTDKNGLFRYDPATGKSEKVFLSEDQLINSINYIEGFGERIWVATKNGIVSYHTKTNNIDLYNTSNGLPHNNINQLYIDINENVWVSTQSNDLYIIKKDKIETIKISDNNENLKINGIARDKSGNIWIATYGNGVYLYDSLSFRNYNVNHGLKSNYCYSVVCDANNNIWIGHRQGMSRIFNDKMIKTYGKDEGILGDCNKNTAYMDASGNIWFGTTEGVIKYDYRKDKKNIIPPSVNITGVKFSDIEADHHSDIKMPYSAYKLSIEMIGISLTDPKGVKYKYMLKGYDLDWNETYESTINYNRIEDGDYELLVKAANSDGVWTQEPVSLKIVISPPIWKKLWFIVLMSAIIVYIIYLIIKIRERNHRKMQEYLKKTLDERTKEVVEQKEEIELQRDQLEQTNKVLESKNKDITDSINYAQRIQAAILPSKTTLQKYFKSSFIFYRPRDIVSGDFYWFEKYHDKFIILCADATGHGVPGAFMSLISITLIKDIIKTSDPDHPGMILTKLDNEIKNTLNQEIDADIKTHDGLDVSVCIIDLNTNILTYASALRPLFVYVSGEMKYIKGSRFPVGGVKTTQKNFEEVKIQLSKGDSIYMFTDGYPDQFGGGYVYEGGKKMKMIRFKNIISKIIHEDINRQYETIENEFDSWKGKYPQIDDVLVIGIKI